MMPTLKKGATLPRPDWPGIETENVASRVVARRLGAVQEGETMRLSHPCDLWVTYRSRRHG